MNEVMPLTLSEVTQHAINPALDLLPRRMDSPRARVQLLTIGLQESQFKYRQQLVSRNGELVQEGPAKSFWQGERMGGMVHGVRTHEAVKGLAAWLYFERGRVKPTNYAIWNAIREDDVLAAALARLLIYTDPQNLPALGDEEGAWDLYLRTWRPGKPHRKTWPGYYDQALAFVSAQELEPTQGAKR